MNIELLKELVQIHSPSGSEHVIKDWVLNYVEEQKSSWAFQPSIYHGANFQDCIILVFGKPKVALYAHLDSIGFTVKYDNELVKIGGPSPRVGETLVGEDSLGQIAGMYQEEKTESGTRKYLEFDRPIERGTTLVYKANFREDEDFIQCCYMDNRLGLLNALEQCKTLKNGAIVLSTYEEHGGGSVGFCGKFLFEEYGVQQALISDITWVTKGVEHGKGVAISMRDSGVPRRLYLNKILNLAKQSEIPFQLEVEDAGGSDGNQLQRSSYPIDWLFIGAPENNVHTSDEIVHKADYAAMEELYGYLFQHLD
ncbi:MAG: putative aminopeptidase FrvX [Sphingobacteriales bacterium]|jgi:putative aminopeptidase FrvX